jgi:Uma2 family endonuclease
MLMAAATMQWTLAELHRLPDDDNTYELVRGALFVTPSPTDPHEAIAARLTRIIDPYAAKHALGDVYRPRAIMLFEGSQVEPDLMVRQPHPNEESPTWETAPTPSLVVEISSRTTWRRDRNEKRELYCAAGVAEYWIVDRIERTITVVKAASADEVVREHMCWHPSGASEPLCFDLSEVFEIKR